jgi:hypothetical protein
VDPVTQHDKILRLLEERGDQGVHSFELYEMRMPRGAAVIHTLKKEGHSIEAEPETYRGEAKGVRYILRGEELFSRPDAQPAAESTSSSSAYDPWGEFA